MLAGLAPGLSEGFGEQKHPLLSGIITLIYESNFQQ